MGFIQNGAKSIKANRGLLNASRSRIQSNSTNTRAKGYTLSPRKEYPNADRKRRRTSIIIFVTVLSTAFLLSFPIISYISESNQSYIENRIRQKERISQNRIDAQVMNSYKLFIKAGNRKLESHQIQDARQDFQKALRNFPNSKEANYGLAKCLLILCKDEGLYCSKAEAYSEVLRSSGTFTAEELGLLSPISLELLFSDN